MHRRLRLLGLLTATLVLVCAPLGAEAHPHAMPPPVSLDFLMLEDKVEAQLLIDVALAEDWIEEAWYQPENPKDPEAVGALTKALLSRFSISIDDNVPTFQGMSVITLASFDLASGEEMEGKLKLMLEAPLDAPAQRLQLVWTNFSGIMWEELVEFPVMVEADRLADSAILSPEEPIFSWRRRPPEFDWSKPIAQVSAPPAPQWSVPVGSLVLAALGVLFGLGLFSRGLSGRARLTGVAVGLALGAAVLPVGALRLETEPLWGEQSVLPSEAQAEKIFATLHENIYKAFANPGREETELEREERIYSELATSVTPELIDPLYVEILESLVLRQQNGVVCLVEKIEKVEGKVTFPAEAWANHFTVDWRWQVLGSITHMGHTHQRMNIYTAQYLVKHDGGAWRIASITVQEHDRVDEDAEGNLTVKERVK